jgi:hypothetical protein
MRVLFDQATPVPLRPFLIDHTVRTATEQRWATLENGALLIRRSGGLRRPGHDRQEHAVSAEPHRPRHCDCRAGISAMGTRPATRRGTCRRRRQRRHPRQLYRSGHSAFTMTGALWVSRRPPIDSCLIVSVQPVHNFTDDSPIVTCPVTPHCYAHMRTVDVPFSLGMPVATSRAFAANGTGPRDDAPGESSPMSRATAGVVQPCCGSRVSGSSPALTVETWPLG